MEEARLQKLLQVAYHPEVDLHKRACSQASGL